MKVGLRHTLKADGTVQPLGFNVGFPWNNSNLPNFYPGSNSVHAVVQYNGERAELAATLGRTGCDGHILDVSSHFPPNPVATDLLRAAYQTATVFGDAVLVTDNRMHWVFRPYKAPADEVRDFDMLLTTPRTLFEDGPGPWIFFHEEPNQSDIVAFKMRWL